MRQDTIGSLCIAYSFENSQQDFAVQQSKSQGTLISARLYSKSMDTQRRWWKVVL
jgi:hypothetical protein